MVTVIVDVINAHCLNGIIDNPITLSDTENGVVSHYAYSGDIDSYTLSTLSMCDIRSGSLQEVLPLVGLVILQA